MPTSATAQLPIITSAPSLSFAPMRIAARGAPPMPISCLLYTSLPRSEAEYHKGKALHARWAQLAAAYGGAVSAEHGVGKIKAPFLRLMYGDAHVAEMAALKAQLDPKGLLGRGNLFAGKGDVI